MARISRRAWVIGAAVAALAVLTCVALPPAPVAAPPPVWRAAGPEARGVFHIHTLHSDGGGSIDEVARAAARAGLKFAIVTDHGDGTRRPDPPAYRDGVLCIDAVEISTTAGHYAALGLGQTPYPLGGEPRDVVEDVRRFGGFGVATHPLSPKRGLAWGDWQAPFDALEWLNGDSVWRDATSLRLARSAWTYALRPVGSLTALYGRPAALDRADSLPGHGRVVLLAGADIHARLGFRKGSGAFRESLFVGVPSYEQAFEVATIDVRLSKPLGGSAAADADAVVEAIRAGHLHTVVDGLAKPGAFELTASSGGASAIEGDGLVLSDAITVRARANVPPGGVIVLFHDGRVIARAAGDTLTYAGNRPGSYRAEVWLDAPREGRARPWIVSNPIYVGTPATWLPPPPPIDMEVEESTIAIDGPAWRPEHDAGSSAALERSPQGITLRYALGDGGTGSPFASLVAAPAVGPAVFGLAFVGVADRPMRISVQARAAASGGDPRWQRSVYLDETPREVYIFFDDMRPTSQDAAGRPSAKDVGAVLFAVDATNTRPGSSGQFTLDRVRLLSKR